MTLARFIRERSPAWKELGGLLGEAGRRPERLGPERVIRLGHLYRAAAADLALARRAFPGDPVVGRLEALVGRSRNLVYVAPTRRGSVLGFLGRGYWRLVLSRPVPLLVATACLTLPAVVSAVWAYRDPAAASGLVAVEYQAVTEPRDTDLDLSSSEAATFSSEIFTNNIRVTLLAFAAGITAGIGTGLLLAFNGILLGTVAGLAAGAGNAGSLVELVTPHGVLELSCIVVGGAAGIRFGWALVSPGRATRRDALGRAGRDAVLIALGTAPWLILAGLVEGFVTPTGLGVPLAVTVGVLLAAAYWALVLVLGRSRAEREPSP